MIKFVSSTRIAFVPFRFFCSRNIKYNDIVKFKNSKIPSKPFVDESRVGSKVKIDKETITHLENLSLVDRANEEGIKVLEDAIHFAQKVLTIDVSDVTPIYTVLENCNLQLRLDSVTDGHCQKDILKNATITLEEYFVAPPGNIPLS